MKNHLDRYLEDHQEILSEILHLINTWAKRSPPQDRTRHFEGGREEVYQIIEGQVDEYSFHTANSAYSPVFLAALGRGNLMQIDMGNYASFLVLHDLRRLQTLAQKEGLAMPALDQAIAHLSAIPNCDKDWDAEIKANSSRTKAGTAFDEWVAMVSLVAADLLEHPEPEEAGEFDYNYRKAYRKSLTVSEAAGKCQEAMIEACWCY